MKPLLPLATLFLLGFGHPSELTAQPAPAAAQQDPPAAARFQLNRHYARLTPTQPTSSGPERVEVAVAFWYGSAESRALEALLEAWRARSLERVSLVRVPIVRDPVTRQHARAWFVAQQLDRAAELHAALYQEIHDFGEPLDSDDALLAFFVRQGVDEAVFTRALHSMAVHLQLQRAEELLRRYRVTTVPAVVVNGKYRSTPAMAGSPDQLIELIEVLSAREAAGQ
jgi:protein dithiol oxidoreductase (disulfide-forming)